jgi:hypothetical protein
VDGNFEMQTKKKTIPWRNVNSIVSVLKRCSTWNFLLLYTVGLVLVGTFNIVSQMGLLVALCSKNKVHRMIQLVADEHTETLLGLS